MNTVKAIFSFGDYRPPVHNVINMQQGHDIGSAMYCYIQKKSAIDIAFRKTLLSLSEQKNEAMKKLFIMFWLSPNFGHRLNPETTTKIPKKIQYIKMAWKDVV